MQAHKTENPTHALALAHLESLGDQDDSAWACVRRIVELVHEYFELQESTNLEDQYAFDNWSWEEHHYGVEYRSCWSSQPWGDPLAGWSVSDAGVEARITLAGGGPAVRIVAELDGYGSTDNFIVEHANWSSWEKIDLMHNDRLPTYVRGYVFDTVARYVEHVAGWIQEL
jgi:hypothetical protein